jgi:hypothetical protein
VKLVGGAATDLGHLVRVFRLPPVASSVNRPEKRMDWREGSIAMNKIRGEANKET